MSLKDLIVIEFEGVGTKMLSLKTCIDGKKIQPVKISWRYWLFDFNMFDYSIQVQVIICKLYKL